MESFEYYSDANFHHVRRVLESLMRTNPGEVRSSVFSLAVRDTAAPLTGAITPKGRRRGFAGGAGHASRHGRRVQRGPAVASLHAVVRARSPSPPPGLRFAHRPRGDLTAHAGCGAVAACRYLDESTVANCLSLLLFAPLKLAAEREQRRRLFIKMRECRFLAEVVALIGSPGTPAPAGGAGRASRPVLTGSRCLVALLRGGQTGSCRRARPTTW